MPVTITEVDPAELRREINEGNYSLTVGCVCTDAGHINVGLAQGATAVEVLAEQMLSPDDSESFGDAVHYICTSRRIAAGVALDGDALQGLMRLVNRAQELCRLAHPPAKAA